MVSEDRSENETTTPLESFDTSQEPVVGAGAGERRGPAGSPRVWRVFRWIAVVLLLGSLGGNWGQYRLWQATRGGGPQEVFHSGEDGATAKLAVIPVEGVSMSPLTDQVLSMIDLVQKDESVRGMVLAIDSPGGLVADSHQI